jgi:molybdopterin synthase catalytic subunit
MTRAADVRVRVRFFAMLRERLGSGGEREVRRGTTAAALWKSIVAEHAGLGRVRVRFAVNEEYVPAGHRLADGDELAVFPPVSGG